MSDGEQRERDFASDEALWRRAQATFAPQDEEERFLDVAAFADGRLDPDERERVAALLSADAAADVEAAQALAAARRVAPAPERVIRRALLARPSGAVGVFRLVPRRPSLFFDLARWGSLAAAVALVGWFGFALGSGATHALDQFGYASAGAFLPHLLDPTTGFLHDLAADMLQ
jgi:anti-sigma factor RsiW